MYINLFSWTDPWKNYLEDMPICRLTQICDCCRCRSDEVRKATTKQVIAQLETICQRRNVNCSVEIKHEAPAAACHPDIIAGLIDACRESEQVSTSFGVKLGCQSPEAWSLGYPPGRLMCCDQY